MNTQSDLQAIEEQLDLLVSQEDLNILRVFLPTGEQIFYIAWQFDHPGKSASQSVNYFTIVSGMEISSFIYKNKISNSKASYIADLRKFTDSKSSAVNVKFNENIPYIFYERAAIKSKS